MSFPLYFDDDSQVRAVIEALRRAGVSAVRSSDVGNEGIADPLHLEFATSRGWTLVTRNARDFQRLHTQLLERGGHHAGIVIVRQSQRLGIGEEIRRLFALQEAMDSAGIRDRLEYLSAWSPGD